VLVNRPRQRVRALACIVSTLLAVSVLTVPLSAEAAPPPNPSDQQITAAQAAKNDLGAQVGQLSAQVTALQTKLNQLRASAELAEQKVAQAIEKLQKAQQAADLAQTEVKQAQSDVVAARQDLSDFIRSTYMLGPAIGTTAVLLTATDPDSVLQHGSYVHYAAEHQLTAIGTMNRATIAKSNADAAARGAVQVQAGAEAAAETAKTNADAAARAAAQQTAAVSASLASSQQQLQSAQANLATLNNQRAAYDAYQAQQAAILLAQQQAAAAAAAAAARNGAGNGNGNSVPVAPSNGHWTAAIGQTAVNRAMAYMNWPYSFAAGNFNGPTYGVAVDFDSRNDAHVYGFDCSGLSLYAWAPYIHMDHYAATQYYQAGSVHPSVANLMPGDLVFWSDDGTVPGIGHVAIYIGNGNVVQAPFSGAFIEVTPLDRVESGYFGATRPLT
jgi:cell wall-associated NlpC family hydrolase